MKNVMVIETYMRSESMQIIPKFELIWENNLSLFLQGNNRRPKPWKCEVPDSK